MIKYSGVEVFPSLVRIYPCKINEIGRKDSLCSLLKSGFF